MSRGTHLVQLQLLPYDIVPVLLEPLQLPEARIGEELGQVGESVSFWMEIRHPLISPQPRGVWDVLPHPEKGNYFQDLNGPVAPGLQQVLHTAVNRVYQSVVLPEGEGIL